MIISIRYFVTMQSPALVTELINRIARIDAAAGWAGDLNPTQRAALAYLARANRFSKSPSHLSSYLGTTRGTTSQSLKSLLQKGYVREHPSETDKRVVRYELTSKGQEIAKSQTPLETAISALDPHDFAKLHSLLKGTLNTVVRHNKAPPFGLCHQCVHHKITPNGRSCLLLGVSLSEMESRQICYEQEGA